MSVQTAPHPDPNKDETSVPSTHSRPGTSSRRRNAPAAPHPNGPVTGESSSGGFLGSSQRARPPRSSGRGKSTSSASIEGAHSVNAAGQSAHTPAGPSSRPHDKRNRPYHPLTADPKHTGQGVTSASTESPPAGPETGADTVKQPSTSRPKSRMNRRGAKFGGKLTESPSEASRADKKPSERYGRSAPRGDDLTSTLIRALSTRPYPDCLICFSEIHPAQPTWSCSPLLPATATVDAEDGDEPKDKAEDSMRCCWTTFHLKCIRPWAVKSVKDIEDAWRARGEHKTGDWRCPGCQLKRTVVPSGYWCFCGSTPEPKPPRLATPHSCGNLCSRPRLCGHSCPIACHPGPCPPCQVTTQLQCHCGKRTLSFRCAHLVPSKTGLRPASELSCGQTCGKILDCGNHTCEGTCHPGACKPCAVRVAVKCYCGKEEKEIGCGEGEEKECIVVEGGAERQWIGKYSCKNACGRLFDCGLHHCSKTCHPPSRTRTPCPRSPALVTRCPCGKHELSPAASPFFPPRVLLTRKACTDPIPTCESTCMKLLKSCAHACSARCHTGPCPLCSILIVRPCRCGAMTRNIRCSENQARTQDGTSENEILCDRVCGALRACGRHQCNRVCCPLASLAALTKGKGKKRAVPETAAMAVADEAGWHQCDLVCGKMLSCGNHRCEERDHRGVCPPCLRSSFEEMICHCGRTILDPPISCGTRITCTYECSRPPLPCGHPKAKHTCHEDPIPCPPCPFLTTKRCACGKKTVDNIRCSQEKVSCGTACGKLLSCGFHHCERLCHSDPCGPCTAVCGKSRKLCLPAHHPCAFPCHAPASCDESEPCRATIYLTCPCGRIRTPISCGRSTLNPAGREGSQQIKCSNECLVAKRNARLAEALGINPNRTDGRQATFSDPLVASARADPKFCALVEKTFDEFLSSDKKSQILPHMTESRRRFVHDLAVVYRMDTQMIDQEPQRSVQLLRRIDSRMPVPILSAVAGVTPPPSVHPPNLGKLADLRAPLPHRPSPFSTPPPQSASSSARRGWTSVVAPPPRASPAADVWSLPASSNVSRPPSRPAVSPVPPVVQPPVVGNQPEYVPDNWEDDP
ncbi:hypothetical protein BKA93DRAFT_788613 [Sparassis latifolia]